MSRVEPRDLVAVLQKNSYELYRKEEKEKLLQNISKINVDEIFNRVSHLIPDASDSNLKVGIKSAIIGAIYGFLDRDLDPFSVKHHFLFSEIISEIEEAHKIVSEGKLDDELWLFETFDYGIKKVYYLDWKLYLSQICY